jgi:23S rRNA (pseudouridine1915-N3)-methyltransferase
MKILIVAIGQRQPQWADSAVDDYLSRFPSDYKVELKALKAEARSGQAQDPDRVRAAEAARVRAALPSGCAVVALDERGKDWTTQQLAQQLTRWRDASEQIAFVIGGPDGLDDTIKRDARLQLRLSSMTLPHALARVVLVEQLYRAWSILAGHPYHRA